MRTTEVLTLSSQCLCPQAKRDAQLKQEEEAKEARRQEALAKKEAAEKAAKEQARRDALQRAKEESERRIRYLERFG